MIFNKKIEFSLIFTLFFVSLSASAQFAPGTIEDYLKRDFKQELKTADFVNQDLIKKYEVSVNHIIKHGIKLEINPVPVAGKKLNLTAGHAITGMDNYVRQRLGAYAYTAIKNGVVDVKVFSGTEDSFLKHLDLQYPELKSVTKLPSLYEEWGISKYLIQEGRLKPLLILKIPTSYRYAQHYATMIRSFTNKSEPVVDYDMKSEARERYELSQGAIRLTQKLGQDYAIISFGYSGTWIDALKQSADWKFVSQASAEDGRSGLNAEILILENIRSKKNQKILLISSKKTVWGELSTMMIGAFLHKHVESVIFMGSAGAVSNKNSIYDLSVPKRFLDKTGRVLVENILHKFKPSGSNEIKINFESTHGNTFSPIEQNRSYLTAINDLGIDTIDVEQSLLAREISEFNIKNKANVKFGAINLVTDKPFSLLQEHHSVHDLDRIDIIKKKRARATAVKFLLGGLASPDINRTTCAFLFD